LLLGNGRYNLFHFYHLFLSSSIILGLVLSFELERSLWCVCVRECVCVDYTVYGEETIPLSLYPPLSLFFPVCVCVRVCVCRSNCFLPSLLQSKATRCSNFPLPRETCCIAGHIATNCRNIANTVNPRYSMFKETDSSVKHLCSSSV
jgi:hypothetical protein